MAMRVTIVGGSLCIYREDPDLHHLGAGHRALRAEDDQSSENVGANALNGKVEVNFHLIPFLSGHDCFRQYLHRFHHAASSCYPECESVEVTPEHLGSVHLIRGGKKMDAGTEEKWNAIGRAVTKMLTELRRK